ncbi:MAG: hypothetical protein ACK551_06510 [Vampirovibrionales bacterium]
MIAVNASTPFQYSPREAEQPPTVNPPASFEATAQPVTPTGQDTAEFSQTQAPTPEATEGTTPTADQATAEASTQKPKAWYQKGFVAPAILGSVATIIGGVVSGFGNEVPPNGFTRVAGAALATTLALVGATVLARGSKKADAQTPAPTEAPAEAKPVA